MKKDMNKFDKTRIMLALAALFFSSFLVVSCKGGGGGYGGGGGTTPPEAFSLIAPSTTMGR